MYTNQPIRISPTPPPTSPPTPQPAAYSQYWTRYNSPCLKQKNTFFQLNMKRKALTLQYNNSHTQLKQTTQYIKAVQNVNRISNRDMSGVIAKSKCKQDISFSASQSNVPGDKGFILYDNPNIPVYNYVPVKRTYQGGNNKYPYTAWKFGMLGHPIGMRGTSREMRRAAALEVSNNPDKYSRTYYNPCFNNLCANQTITDVNITNISTNNNLFSTTSSSFPLHLQNISSMPDISLDGTKLYPVILDPEYTGIGDQGLIWCSQYLKAKSDNSYIYFLTNNNNQWWYSVSRLDNFSKDNIKEYSLSDFKTLAYPMFAPYPFIEFKLSISSNKVNNVHNFNIDEIYFQTLKPTTDISVILNNIPIQGNDDYKFTSNRCLQNSGIKLFFTMTNNDWTKAFFYRPIENSANSINNRDNILQSQCSKNALMNPCEPCNGVETNCGNFSGPPPNMCIFGSYTCPSYGVFNVLTNTFWWRVSNDENNIFNYQISNKFKDITLNLDISAWFKYSDFCTTKKHLQLTMKCQ